MPLPRLHKSTIFVSLFAVTVTFLLEVPGHVVSGSNGGDPHRVVEHGWPWCYLRRDTVDYDPPIQFKTPDGTTIIGNVEPVIGFPIDLRRNLPHWATP